MKKSTFKKYLMSSLVTFMASFAVVILANIDSLQLADLSNGAIASVIFTAIRAGVKAVFEQFVTVK